MDMDMRGVMDIHMDIMIIMDEGWEQVSRYIDNDRGLFSIHL